MLPHRFLVVLIALIFAIGLPMYYLALKRVAAASLAQLLAERFSTCTLPLSVAPVPAGGRVLFHSAYNDKLGSGFVLVLGNRVWSFSKRGAHQRVAGLFKPGNDTGWVETMRRQRDILLATTIEGGSLVVWKGLPSRKSVLAHLKISS